jgi:hypothetical protein
MLVIYTQPSGISWFETDFSDRIRIKDVYNSTINPNKYEYIVGNDLFMIEGIGNQICIDVCKIGLDYLTLEKFGLEAIVYVYNNWYIPDSPFMRVDQKYGKYLLRDIPKDANHKQISLPTGNKRYNFMNNEIKNACKQANFIGAIWPTCHYLTDTSKMWLIFGNRLTTIKSNASRVKLLESETTS